MMYVKMELLAAIPSHTIRFIDYPWFKSILLNLGKKLYQLALQKKRQEYDELYTTLKKPWHLRQLTRNDFHINGKLINPPKKELLIEIEGPTHSMVTELIFQIEIVTWPYHALSDAVRIYRRGPRRNSSWFRRVYITFMSDKKFLTLATTLGINADDPFMSSERLNNILLCYG
jgi:hypothetical protein